MSAGDHLVDDDDANATKLIKTSKVGSDEKNEFLNFSFHFTFSSLEQELKKGSYRSVAMFISQNEIVRFKIFIK